MPVEKFAAVIAVKAQDGKGQRRFNLGDALLHQVMAAIPHRPALGPLGVNIREGDAPAKLSRHRFPAVGHRVGLDKTRHTHVPVLGANWNLAAQ